MATFDNLLGMRTFKAGADLSLKQYSLVKLDNTGAVVLCATAGERPLGILANTPALGQAAQVAPIGAGGKMKVKLAGTVAIGGSIATDVTGAGVTSVTVGHVICGFADEAGAAGEVISVTLESGHTV